ncbi:MAG: PA0069 family radical SAM protein [bacterium]|jgi:DNA repair photolyase
MKQSIRGRGSHSNPPNRFEQIEILPEADDSFPEEVRPETRFYRDSSRSIITRNDSPDIPYTATINPYRGCEHGCIYCYARPTHEYLGLSSGLDFETRIYVKENAPDLLRHELSRSSWQPQTISLCGITDPYQPVERRLQLTRRCLTVLREFHNPVSIVTKNYLVTRDIDILADMAQYQEAVVVLSLTTLDPNLAQLMEPRTSQPRKKLQALRELRAAGVPAGILLSPVIPGLTDHEIPRILDAAADVGALFAGFILLRLPWQNKVLFTHWLELHFPTRKEKVLHHIQQTRGGKLYDSRFGKRMTGEGILADQIRKLFHITCMGLNLNESFPPLTTANFRIPTRDNSQPVLFEL